MKFGVTADIHSSGDQAEDAPDRLFEVFAGVDAVVACGDHSGGAVLDRLASVARLTATRNPGVPEDGGGHRLDEFAVVEAGPNRLGVVFSLPQLGIEVSEEGTITWPTGDGLGALLAEKFGGPVDAVLFGGTHQPLVASVGGVLFVNPGSPRFAARTTAALVDVSDRSKAIAVEIVDV